ncbi:hypothetical protein [Lacinutrix sp.]|uniref:hypothetical protein n=1 Tax=Lacinutrix sp. TaxID=1937692 RepID=UPI0035C816A5
MRIFKYIIIFLLFANCTDKNVSETEKIFNQTLGSDNTETLNKLVDDFENDYLKKQYPETELKLAYRKFVEDVRDEKFFNRNIKIVSKKSFNLFKSSELYLELYQFPDSVWVVRNSSFDKLEDSLLLLPEIPHPYIKRRYKDLEENGEFVYGYSRKFTGIALNADLDSIVKSEYKTVDFNYSGKYMKALNRIKNQNKYYEELYNAKNSVGFIYKVLTARKMLHHNLDLNDKLNRKLVVLELIY